MAKRSFYHEAILSEAARQGFITAPIRHIEAWMRLEHPTLDGLGSREFALEVRNAIFCIKASTYDESERLAKSFGL